MRKNLKEIKNKMGGNTPFFVGIKTSDFALDMIK